MCTEDLGVQVKDEPTASRGSGYSLGRMAGDPSLGFILQLNSWSQGRQGPSPVPQELSSLLSCAGERGGLHRKMRGAGLLLPPCGALGFRPVGGRRGRLEALAGEMITVPPPAWKPQGPLPAPAGSVPWATRRRPQGRMLSSLSRNKGSQLIYHQQASRAGNKASVTKHGAFSGLLPSALQGLLPPGWDGPLVRPGRPTLAPM